MVTITDNTPVELLLGENHFRQEGFTAAGALTFPKGLLLGRITATGKYTFFNPGAADGTEVQSAVLTEEFITTGAGDTEIRIMVSGLIRDDQLLEWNAGTPHAATAVEKFGLRDYGIIPKTDRELLRFDNST